MTTLADGLSVIIPLFNEDATISDVVLELMDLLPAFGLPFEVIVVNDGSTDNSWKIIESFASQNASIRGINLARNYGQHLATLAGLRAARFATTITMDADGQHDAHSLRQLIHAMNEGYDVAYGYSLLQKNDVLQEPLTIAVQLLLGWLKLFPDARKVSSYRVFRTALRDHFKATDNAYINIDTLLRASARRFQYLPIARKTRLAGTSSQNWSAYFMNLTNLITSHSLRPVRLIGLLSLITTATGLVLLVYSSTNPWWLTGVFSLLTGMVLFAIALVGEYVARYYLLSIHKHTLDIHSDTGNHP